MQRRPVMLAAALVSAGLGLTACSSSGQSTASSTGASSAGAGQPLQIAAIEALSGPLAPVGNAMKQGLEAAVSVINAHGGVFGKPVQLTVRDDAGTPDQTVSVLQDLLSGSSKPDAVVPGSVSTEIAAALPILTKYKVFTSDNGAVAQFNDPAKYPYAFGNVYLADDEAKVLADELAAKGYKSVGLVTQNDERGNEMAAALKDQLTAKGISLTSALVPDTAVDATPQLQQIQAASPDALVIDAFVPVASAILKARVKLAMSIPAYGTQALSGQDLSSVGGASDFAGISLHTMSFDVQGTPVDKTPAFTAFLKSALSAADGTLTQAISVYECAYDDVMLAAAAARTAKSTDGAAMAEAAEHLTTTQAPYYVGPLGFSPTSHYPDFTNYWVYTSFGPTVNGQLAPQK